MLLGDELAGAAGEFFEQVPLGGGQPQLAAVASGDAVGTEVHCVLPDAYGGRGGVGRGGAAGDGADAGEEFVDAERFGDVVVGAGVERGDLVPTVGPAGDDDDRHAGP